MNKLRLILPVLAAAAVWPAAGNAATLHGTVVARSHGMLLVATPSGAVQSVRGSAAVGSRLDGTRVVGRATRARIHGVVVRRVGTTVFLSSNRHLLAFHTRTPADVAPVQGTSVASQPGSVVNATVGIQPNGQLDEENEDQVGQAGSTLQVQATVTAVGAGTVTVSVNGQSLTVSLPNGLTLPAAMVGQTVTFTVALGGNGGGDDQGDDQGSVGGSTGGSVVGGGGGSGGGGNGGGGGDD